MPDVVELARAAVKAFDEHGSAAMDPEVAAAVDALRIELERIDALLATPPDPGSLDALLLEQIERVRRQGE